MIPVACDLCGADDARDLLAKAGGHYVQCRRCGFVYANPRPEEEDSINNQAFEDSLAKYARKFSSAKAQRSYQRNLRRFEPYRQTNQLLEIGSNAGAFLHAARELRWEPTGVEPAAACARYGQEHYGLKILPCTLEMADLPEGSFDVVYANAVFEHLPSPTTAFQSAHRVLRPGGVLYVDTVNYDSYTRRFLGEEWKLLNPSAHLSLFSAHILRQFCIKAGFEVLAITTHGVRFRTSRPAKARGLMRWGEELLKLPLSVLCRLTLKGDSISVLARKP